MVFDASLTANKTSDKNAYSVYPGFEVMTMDGVEIIQEETAYFPLETDFTSEQFRAGELDEGEEMHGKSAVLVPIDEVVIIKFWDWCAEVYFSTEDTNVD